MRAVVAACQFLLAQTSIVSTRRRMPFRHVTLAAMIAIATAIPASATAQATDSGSPPPVSVAQDLVPIVGPEIYQFRAASEEQAMAFDHRHS